MQRTLVLLKCDTIERGLAGAILERFEKANLRVEDCRLVRPDLAHWERHYSDLRNRNARAFERSTRYLAGKPVIAIILSGPNAIQKARALAGPTDPLKAPPGTIRGDYGTDSIDLADLQDRATLNLVHAADSEESAQNEAANWFPK